LSSDEPWYYTIPSVLVVPFGDDVAAQAALDKIATAQTSDGAQFGADRHAVLLLKGVHDLNITVGYYTSVAGVGACVHGLRFRYCGIV
jgi:hypothetical protein